MSRAAIVVVVDVCWGGRGALHQNPGPASSSL